MKLTDLRGILQYIPQFREKTFIIAVDGVIVTDENFKIIPGKGSGQLKKRVLRFLDQKEIKQLYHRVEKDSRNFGRVFVHFRH